jgi:hypothetical protein
MSSPNEALMLDALQRIAALLAEVKGRHAANVAYVLAQDTIAKVEMSAPPAGGAQ